MKEMEKHSPGNGSPQTQFNQLTELEVYVIDWAFKVFHNNHIPHQLYHITESFHLIISQMFTHKSLIEKTKTNK